MIRCCCTVVSLALFLIGPGGLLPPRLSGSHARILQRGLAVRPVRPDAGWLDMPEPGAERWSVRAMASSEESAKGNIAENAFDGDRRPAGVPAAGRQGSGSSARPATASEDQPRGPGLGVPRARLRQRHRDQRPWQGLDRVRARAPRGSSASVSRSFPKANGPASARSDSSTATASRSGTRGFPAARPRRPPTSTIPTGDRSTSLTTGASRARSATICRAIPASCPGRASAGIASISTCRQSDQGKRIFIDFDGAMANARVWLNGQYVGGWPYGYQPFRLELTPHLKFGAENVLAVRLDTVALGLAVVSRRGALSQCLAGEDQPRSRGPLGRVRDHADRSPTRRESPGSSSRSRTRATDDATRLGRDRRSSSSADGMSGQDGRQFAARSSTRSAAGASGNVAGLDRRCPDPKRWDLDRAEPLPGADDRSRRATSVVDVYDQPFGFRTIEFTPRDGFKLNGRRVPLNGTCNHHDLGPLGAALNVRALERQLEILKEMGCNALRTSHNPPAPELLDLADRMGFVVMVEAFDCWKQGKTAGRLQPALRRVAREGPAGDGPPRAEPSQRDHVEHRQRDRRAERAGAGEAAPRHRSRRGPHPARHRGLQQRQCRHERLPDRGRRLRPQLQPRGLQPDPRPSRQRAEADLHVGVVVVRQLAGRVLLPRQAGQGLAGELPGLVLRRGRPALGPAAGRGLRGARPATRRSSASSSGPASTTSASRRPTTPTPRTCSTSPTPRSGPR